MKKSTVAISCLLALGLTACGSSSSSSSSEQTPTSTLSGVANKGIVSGAVVTACDAATVTDGQCSEAKGDDNSFWQQVSTDENGQYQLTEVTQGTPLLITIGVNADGNTQMKCDVVECENADGSKVGFGKTVTLADDFTLSAVVDGVSTETSTANITALTTIAADVAIKAAGAEGINAKAVAAANTAVQTAFGLTQPINQIGGVDLTDAAAVAAAAVAAADAETLQASLYSATVLQSGVDASTLISSNNGEYEINKAIAQEIQQHTTEIVEQVEQHGGEIPATVEQQIDNQQDLLQDAIDNGTPLTVIEVEEGVKDGITQAKSFINDVRTAYRSVQDDGDLTTGLEDFADEIEEVADLVQEDTDTALSQAGAAIDAVIEAFDDNATGEYTASNGYQVTVADTQYTVTSENTALVATITKYEFKKTTDDCWDVVGDCKWVDSTNIEMDVSVDSLTTTANDVTLTASGSVLVEGLVEGWKGEVSEEWSEEFGLSADTIEITLAEATLSHADKGSLFSGSIELSTSGYEDSDIVEDTCEELEQGYECEWVETSRFTFATANLTLNGELTANNNSAGVYLDIAVDNSAGIVDGYQFSELWQCSPNAQGGETCLEEDSETALFQESADQFVKATILARVNTDLIDAANNATASQVELSVDRSAYNAVDAVVTVSYNSVDTIVESSFALYEEEQAEAEQEKSQLVTVRNIHGVIATIDTENDDLDGVITVDNTEVATITDSGNGTIVRYTDGTMESIF